MMWGLEMEAGAVLVLGCEEQHGVRLEQARHPNLWGLQTRPRKTCPSAQSHGIRRDLGSEEQEQRGCTEALASVETGQRGRVTACGEPASGFQNNPRGNLGEICHRDRFFMWLPRGGLPGL